MTDKKERKNTQALIDYVNACENADPDVVALYSKMGAMENIRANGIPMKVSHGKGYAVNYRYYTRNDQLADVELIIPKLAGDDLTGQVVTTLHEEMHLMDMSTGQTRQSVRLVQFQPCQVKFLFPENQH